MKLSMTKIRSTAIALPLVVVSLMMANPVIAEQISRSTKSIDEDTAPVTELNLAIPGERSTSNSSRKNSPMTDASSPKTSTNKQSKKVESKSKANSTIATNINTSTPLANQTVRSKSRQNSTIATNINTSTPSANPNIRSNSKRKIATNSLPPLAGNYLRLVRDPSKGTNAIGNPIYTLEAYVNGRRYQSFKAVSGTATTQDRDRDTANNFSPLPDGNYKVSTSIVASNTPEVGKTFIAIYPQFETGRTDLGIHQDPSFNKRNGSDGTAGCIGLTTAADRDAVNSFVSKYHPRNLIVKIDTQS
jgi:hypothetical protein